MLVDEDETALHNIRVSKSVKRALEDMKIHHREPYNDVIIRLLLFAEKQELTSHPTRSNSDIEELEPEDCKK